MSKDVTWNGVIVEETEKNSLNVKYTFIFITARSVSYVTSAGLLLWLNVTCSVLLCYVF